MSEGIDLKYEIARGQIILKRPTPNMGDPYIKTMINGHPLTNITPDPEYFTSVVFSTVIQQYGRIMRAKDDWGYTVIVDQSMCRDILSVLHPKKKLKREMMNIDYFIQAIQYKVEKGLPSLLWLDK
jgi:Rad3-related DNA helicase